MGIARRSQAQEKGGTNSGSSIGSKPKKKKKKKRKKQNDLGKVTSLP